MGKLHTHLTGLAEIRYCECDEPWANEPIYYKIRWGWTILKYAILVGIAGLITWLVAR